MTIYDETAQYLAALPALAAWPEMGAYLISAAANEPHDWWLPVLASVAVGGDQSAAIPGVASIAALQASIILIDDMLDADPRGRHLQIGMPAAANMASALQAVSLAAIYEAGPLPAARKAAIMHSLGQMMSQIARGQQLDVQNPADEAGYWRVVQTKSAPFFSIALYIGALCGGAAADVAGQLAALGNLYGEMIQIHDDLLDTMAEPAGPDWLLGRSPLPILFALTVPHPERDLFSSLRYQVRNPAALRLAQAILVRCGAVSYAVDQILQRHEQAQTLLSTMVLARPEKLTTLFTALVEPVTALMEAGRDRPVGLKA